MKVVLSALLLATLASSANAQLMCDADEQVGSTVASPNYNTEYDYNSKRLDYVVIKVDVTPNQSGAEFTIQWRRQPYQWESVAVVTTNSNNQVVVDGNAVGSSGQTVTVSVQHPILRQKFQLGGSRLLQATSGTSVANLKIFGEFGEDIPGDFNGSGLVEQGDLDLVSTNWGVQSANVSVSWMRGHLPSGNVDQGEQDLVLNNWGGDCN